MRSKRLSAASSSSASPERPTLFLDRSLGRIVVAEALRREGARVEIHGDHFEHDSPDEEWLTQVADRGWTVLTKDVRIRYRPNELAAIRSSRAIVVMLGAASLTGEQMAAIFVRALKRIETTAAHVNGPAIFQLGRDARLKRVRL